MKVYIYTTNNRRVRDGGRREKKGGIREPRPCGLKVVLSVGGGNM